jgi:transposase
MGRKKVERHNAEFIELYKESGLSQREIAAMLGVALITVKSWCVNEESDFSAGCPKWRVDVFKIALGRKFTWLSARHREELLDLLRSITS